MRPNNNQNNKNRSRGRNGGRKHINPLSRNFESNGPDVKVRGNAAHIAEKYVQLARDAQASGDSVMAENYLQHAEHYYRIVSAAQPQGMSRPDGFGQDFDGDYEDGDDVVDTNNRFEPRFSQNHQAPQPHAEAEQPAPLQVSPEPVASIAAQPEIAAAPGEDADPAPRRTRERRPRRRPRTSGEGADSGPEAGGSQPDLAELPAFLTGGTAPAE